MPDLIRAWGSVELLNIRVPGFGFYPPTRKSFDASVLAWTKDIGESGRLARINIECGTRCGMIAIPLRESTEWRTFKEGVNDFFLPRIDDVRTRHPLDDPRWGYSMWRNEDSKWVGGQGERFRSSTARGIGRFGM